MLLRLSRTISSLLLQERRILNACKANTAAGLLPDYKPNTFLMATVRIEVCLE
jgi:hypothetical protein